MGGAVVVGEGRGIELALMRRFAAEGMRTGVVTSSSETAAAAVNVLTHRGSRGMALYAHPADISSLRGALTTVATRFGVPEVIIYNACGADRATWETGVGGLIATIEHLGTGLAALGSGSILLVMTAPAATASLVEQAMAGALDSLAQTLIRQYGPFGIHVATVTVIRSATDSVSDPEQIAEACWQLHAQSPAATWDHHLFVEEPAASL